MKAGGFTVEWDVWEEPNWKGWWGRDRRQFFETYARFHRKLRTLDPNAVIVGPSINRYDPEYLKAFLLYAKENDVAPDLLSWHELIEQHRPIIIPYHVKEMEEFMAEEGIRTKGIDINEFCSPERQTSPGLNAMYLANLEVARVNGACRACWRDHDGKIFNGWNPMLDGLLTPKLEPRSTWWVFKTYAELTGDLYPITIKEGKWTHGLAGVSHDDEVVRMLIGRNEFPSKPQTLSINGIRNIPWLLEDDRVRVVADIIPNSGWEELKSTSQLFDKEFSVRDGKLTLRLPVVAEHQALTIKPVHPTSK
jgi:hypothetical protein